MDMVLERVKLQVTQHQNTWRDKPEWYWFYGLLKEIVELGLALVGLHKGPIEWELLQIATICVNWLDYRRKQR